MSAWKLGAWALGAWRGTAWAEAPTPPAEQAFGGYGPILRWKRNDDDEELLAVFAAFTQIQEGQ